MSRSRPFIPLKGLGRMNLWAKLFYRYRRFWKVFKLYLILAGPGIIVMVADNDAGGITTYAVKGANTASTCCGS